MKRTIITEKYDENGKLVSKTTETIEDNTAAIQDVLMRSRPFCQNVFIPNVLFIRIKQAVPYTDWTYRPNEVIC